MKLAIKYLIVTSLIGGVIGSTIAEVQNDNSDAKLIAKVDDSNAKWAIKAKNAEARMASKSSSSSVVKTTKVTTALSIPPVYQATSVNAPADVNSVAQQMEVRTGVSASTWAAIIMRESGGNSGIYNSQGYYGLFQLAPGYAGNGGDVQAQIDNAVYLYDNGGLSHWAATVY